MLYLIKTEPAKKYGQLMIENNLLRIVERGRGEDLREQLYTELISAKDEQTKSRVKDLLSRLRSINWPD